MHTARACMHVVCTYGSMSGSCHESIYAIAHYTNYTKCTTKVNYSSKECSYNGLIITAISIIKSTMMVYITIYSTGLLQYKPYKWVFKGSVVPFMGKRYVISHITQQLLLVPPHRVSPLSSLASSVSHTTTCEVSSHVCVHVHVLSSYTYN